MKHTNLRLAQARFVDKEDKEEEMIPETVTLPFDPEKTEEVKAVFCNDLARTIWLAVRPGHIVSNYFNDDCLYYAKAIEDIKKERPITAKLLFYILSSGLGRGPDHVIIGSKEQDFAAELLPFVNGEKTINFTLR